MKQLAFCVLLAVLVAATQPGFAQQPNFKSQEEFDAFMKIQTAQSAPERATASAEFIGSFPDSEAAGLASYMAMLSYQAMNDFENMLLYGDMVLETDQAPGVLAGTLISLASAIPARTREFDLDKEEKLSKAEDYAKRAMALIPTLPKSDPNISDDEWLAAKMDFMSQCHESLGSVAAKREDYTLAEASYRKAMEMASEPLPYTMYQFAGVLAKQGRHDEAAEIAAQCAAAGGFRDATGADLCAEYSKASN